MNSIILSLTNMLRLRGGPQSLPNSLPFLVFLVVAFLLQNLFTGQQLDDDNAAAKALLAIGLQITVLSGLLYWRRRPERFVQTLSALVAVGIVFNGITWGLLLQSNPDSNQPLLAMVWFSVFIWSLFVDANIYRHTLSVNLSIGMLITVLTLAISFVAIEFLFLPEIST